VSVSKKERYRKMRAGEREKGNEAGKCYISRK
jgi:hypothetical protein